MSGTKLFALDFAAIRDLVPLRRALEHAGWRPHPRCVRGDRGKCVHHHSTRKISRSMQVNRTTVYCHTCRWSGDVIAVWGELHQLPYLEAAYDLCRTFGIAPPPKAPAK